uniref:Uncharacterized protein n=1 Tax=Meloidogyne javanica TaxID=6303 RepID=A0A915MGN1_MELJA
MPCQLPEGIENVSDDVFSYMCNLAMEKCSDKGEKKKASCGGAAMRKRLLIKNFVAQMLSQEQQTKNLQQQYLDARESVAGLLAATDQKEENSFRPSYAVENSLLSGNKDIYNGSWHFYGGIDTSFDSLNGGLLTENLMLDNDQQQNEHIDKLLEKDGNTTKLFLMERAAEPLIDEISEHSQQHLVGFSNMVPYIMKFSNEDTLFYNPQEGENQQQNSRCLTNLDNAKLVENENTHQQVDIFESRKRPWYSQSEWSHFEENSGGVCDDNHFEQHQQFSPLCCGFLQLQQFGNNSGSAQTCGNSTINEPLIKRVKL